MTASDGRLQIVTTRKVEAVDVTDLIPRVSGRLVWIGAPHTTVALVVCEADDAMLLDLERAAVELFAPMEPFAHARNGNRNAAAHLVSAMAGAGVVLPVADGHLSLGRWQRLILLELDGPKTRELIVQSI